MAQGLMHTVVAQQLRMCVPIQQEQATIILYMPGADITGRWELLSVPFKAALPILPGLLP